MSTKRMLVDATHPEETRIVVTSGNRLDEFDFEAASRRQLRGNIYLAKVTRVEPSLQAAFVDYGGNRHGFLAFSEIHPDYYQIPVADREALIAAEEAEDANDHAEEPAEAEAEDVAENNGDEAGNGGNVEQTVNSDESVDSVGGDDAIEEAQSRKRNLYRKYKIQEVIKRRQVMLVQVVKEERGNKGAALTSYLSLAGRYSVLMPNTARGGGISRKITNSTDRKRLKEIATELQVPQGMGIILRTAGAARTKAEVKRDFEYLLRLWENVRSVTLQSSAPCLVYEEGSLIKRTIRDLYNKDIDEVLVSGDAAYREAKDFMRMIMPSHAKNVQQYREDQPIFSKFAVETQLDSMFSPQVTLPSGGYIVINPTEALVSIDVNSGRSTREHNIEDTAYQTNLEAADEVARQLRLRDMAGLIVIDFIDMMERRSIRNVERRLKDALKDDRARIQVGRISHFGLMEMSRQRIRFGVLESSTHLCPTCQGAGMVRSVESLALMVMRAIEDQVLRKGGLSLNVKVPTDVALYILNAKRVTLMDLEAKYGLGIAITADAKLTGNHFQIERSETRLHGAEVPRAAPVRVDSADMDDYEDEPEVAEAASADEEDDKTERTSRRRRRRRGGRGRNDQDSNAPGATETTALETTVPEKSDDQDDDAPSAEHGEGDDDGTRKRRRRGRRGGRRNRRPGGEETGEASSGDFAAQDAVEGAQTSPKIDAAVTAVNDRDGAKTSDAPENVAVSKPAAVVQADSVAKAKDAAEAEDGTPKKPRRSRKKPVAKKLVEAQEAAPEAKPTEPAKTPELAAETAASPAVREKTAVATPDKPKRLRKALPPEGVVVTSSANPDAEVATEKPKKAGWWQKGFFS